jgi:hypothetical protein
MRTRGTDGFFGPDLAEAADLPFPARLGTSSEPTLGFGAGAGVELDSEDFSAGDSSVICIVGVGECDGDAGPEGSAATAAAVAAVSVEEDAAAAASPENRSSTSGESRSVTTLLGRADLADRLAVVDVRWAADDIVGSRRTRAEEC